NVEVQIHNFKNNLTDIKVAPPHINLNFVD
ncbi:MAG: hypothetical protein ACI9YH_004749, partial [Colwellia sp.]